MRRKVGRWSGGELGEVLRALNLSRKARCFVKTSRVRITTRTSWSRRLVGSRKWKMRKADAGHVIVKDWDMFEKSPSTLQWLWDSTMQRLQQDLFRFPGYGPQVVEIGQLQRMSNNDSVWESRLGGEARFIIKCNHQITIWSIVEAVLAKFAPSIK